MISTSDLPACPACGSREVHVVSDPPRTFYACRQCGRDQTAAWDAVQPKPYPMKIIGPDVAAKHFDRVNPPAVETIAAAATRLGIAAKLKRTK